MLRETEKFSIYGIFDLSKFELSRFDCIFFLFAQACGNEKIHHIILFLRY